MIGKKIRNIKYNLTKKNLKRRLTDRLNKTA